MTLFIESIPLFHSACTCLSKFPISVQSQFGIIKTKGSRLIEMVEKPLQKNYVNAGIYAFNKIVYYCFQILANQEDSGGVIYKYEVIGS